MDNYFKTLEKIESGGRGEAKNPNSSAKGFFQWTDATAKQYGLLVDDVDYRGDRVKEEQALAQFTEDNKTALKNGLGREPTEGELYLAHQQGAGGALKLLQNPDANAIEVVGSKEVLDNGGKEGMTAKEFAARWTSKFDNTQITGQGGNETMIGGDGQDAANKYAKAITLPDGGRILLNGTETPDKLLKLKVKLAEQYGNTINIDRKSGAPAAVRAFVGSVSKPEDKLASLQQYFPDAIQYGEDNFVYTNPDNGKLTLYNPKGFDIAGDLASVSREAVQTYGSMRGAAFGLMRTGTLKGAMAGSGAGAVAAGSAFDMLVNKLGLTVDSRSAAEKTRDYAVEGSIWAAGEGIGTVASKVIGKAAGAAKTAIKTKVKSLSGGGNPASQRLLQQFKSFGISPSASLTTGNAGIARIEASLAQNPASAEIMAKQAASVVDDTHKALNKIILDIGDPKTAQGAGETIRQAAINAAERFNFRQEKLYDEAFDLIGADTRVSVKAVEALGKDLKSALARAPESLKGAYSKAISDIDNIVVDAQGGGIQFQALREIRTAIGRDLASPQLTGSTGAQNEAMKRIYGALTEDLSLAATNTSQEAAKKLATADRYTRVWSNTAKQTMEKISKFDADERAFKFALNSARDGGTSLTRLRRNFTEEEWDTVAASVLDKLGDATAGMQNAAGDQFSINTFLTNWNKLSPEAKTALFGGKRYAPQKQALEQLTELMSKIKDVSRFENTSNTSGAMQAYVLFSALGGAGGYVASGDLSGAAKGAVVGAGALLAPRYAAKLITNPKFVEWLSGTLTQAATKTGKGFSTQAHMARLAIIAKEEPEIEMEIREYMKALREQTKE